MNAPRSLFPLLLLFALAGCKKDLTELDRLPEATQAGTGTAGFLLDGKTWLPLVSDQTGDPAVTGYWRRTPGGRSLSVSLTHISRTAYTSTAFFVPDIRQPGTFPLRQDPNLVSGRRNAAYGAYHVQRPSPGVSYYTGPDAPGELRITRFDTVSNIVAGTFELTPREEGGTATVALTQGRFDLHFDR